MIRIGDTFFNESLIKTIITDPDRGIMVTFENSYVIADGTLGLTPDDVERLLVAADLMPRTAEPPVSACLTETDYRMLESLRDDDFLWVAADADRNLYAYSSKPVLSGAYYDADGSDDVARIRLTPGALGTEYPSPEPIKIDDILSGFKAVNPEFK